MLTIGILGLGAIGTLMAYHCRHQAVYSLNPENQIQHRQLTLLNKDECNLELPAWEKPVSPPAQKEQTKSSDQPLDWLIVTTKAGQTLQALEPWLDSFHQVKRLLLIQNGMGQQEALLELFKERNLTTELWLGISTEGAFRASRESVTYAGKGMTRVGRIYPGSNCDDLSPAEFASIQPFERLELESNIWQPMRDKLAINAVINPLTAHWRCLNGEILSNPEYWPKTQALIEEVEAAFEALGWTLSFNLHEQVMLVAKATASNRSSTLQDVFAGRMTELPHISGYLIKSLSKTGVSMPISESLLAELDNPTA